MQKLKNVLFIWIIVYALITVLVYSFNIWLMEIPIYLRTLVLSLTMVFGLQYAIFPIVEKFKTSHNH